MPAITLAWVCVLLGMARAAPAQSAPDELGTWLILRGTNHISHRWTLYNEAQLRLYEVASDPEEVLLQLAPQYNLNPGAQVGFGYSYDWLWSFDDAGDGPGEADATENRLHEQLALKQTWGATALEHRYRVEQRWQSQGGETSYSNRVRYRFQVTVPLRGSLDRAGAIFINASDEIFVDVASTLSFNQNRLTIAAGYRIGDRMDFQFGYLYLSQPDQNLQRLQIYFTYGTPFRNFFQSRL